MSTEQIIGYHDIEAITQLLVGRSVRSVDIDENELILDDLTRIRIAPNEGGCACSAGDYEVTRIAQVENIITDVQVVNDPSGDDNYHGEGYRIFVFTGHEKINLLQVDGSDGNGYYGTGYYLHVEIPDPYLISETP